MMRIFTSGKEKVVAICDCELLGRTFKEGELVLDLDRYAGFYSGKRVEEAEAEKELMDATSINLVGERAVGLAKRAKFVKDSEVLRIANVPHVQIYTV